MTPPLTKAERLLILTGTFMAVAFVVIYLWTGNLWWGLVALVGMGLDCWIAWARSKEL